MDSEKKQEQINKANRVFGRVYEKLVQEERIQQGSTGTSGSSQNPRPQS